MIHSVTGHFSQKQRDTYFLPFVADGKKHRRTGGQNVQARSQPALFLFFVSTDLTKGDYRIKLASTMQANKITPTLALSSRRNLKSTSKRTLLTLKRRYMNGATKT